jgi:hypothetical protein
MPVKTSLFMQGTKSAKDEGTSPPVSREWSRLSVDEVLPSSIQAEIRHVQALANHSAARVDSPMQNDDSDWQEDSGDEDDEAVRSPLLDLI